MVDERTVKDGSVLVVDTDYVHDESEEGRRILKGVRFEPVHVPVAVANLEIANLMLGDVSVHVVISFDVLNTYERPRDVSTRRICARMECGEDSRM